MTELDLALKEAGRRLKTHLTKKAHRAKTKEKFEIVQLILPRIADKSAKIVNKKVPVLDATITKIMGVVWVDEDIAYDKKAKRHTVTLNVHNFTAAGKKLNLHLLLPRGIQPKSLEPKPAEVRDDGKITWELKRIDSVAKASISFVLEGLDEAEYDESEIYEELDGGQIPKMKIPLRTKANIRFDSKHAVWKYGNLMGVRSAKKLKGALMLLRTMYVLEFIRDMIRDSKSSTLREMYYISEGWDIAKFHAQEESNLLAEDLEVITQLLREDFKLRPEESGASVVGNLTIEEITRTGDRKRINCRDDVGDAGYTIPYNVEKEKVKLVEADAKFILAIETGGMFDRLVENGFDQDAKCILGHFKGEPSRSTRSLLERLNEELKLPVATFSVSGEERILVWEKGRLRPVTIGPFVDRLMEEHGAVLRSVPIEHERLSVDHLDLEVPSITGDGERLDRARVTAVIRHGSPDSLFEVRTAYGWSAKVTGSHSLMVFDNYRLVSKPVAELGPGELVVAAAGLPRADNEEPIDVVQLLRPSPIWKKLRTDVAGSRADLPLDQALGRGFADFGVRLLGKTAAERLVEREVRATPGDVR